MCSVVEVALSTRFFLYFLSVGITGEHCVIRLCFWCFIGLTLFLVGGLVLRQDLYCSSQWLT